jgi:23S rRNA G2445 N2-methylase RlmL
VTLGKKAKTKSGFVARWKVPPGMWEQARMEAQRLLAHSWLPPAKERPRLEDDGTRTHLRIEGLSASGLTELVARARVAEDIEWVLGEGRCTEFPAYEALLKKFLSKEVLPAALAVQARTDARGSRLYHEGALRERLETALVACGHPTRTEGSTEGTVVFARLEKDRLTLSVSLSDRRLAQRGYKASLSAPAPLREELAAGCWEMLRAATPEAFETNVSTMVWCPFAGSGTFGFEGVSALADATPGLRGRTNTLPCMQFSWWSAPTWEYLVKKSETLIRESTVAVSFLERDTNASASLSVHADAFLAAMGVAPSDAKNANSRFEVTSGDFFGDTTSFLRFPAQCPAQWILVPVNPPYGVRLAHRSDSPKDALSARIALRLLDVAKRLQDARKTAPGDADKETLPKPPRVAGVLLCGSEDEWKSAMKSFTPSLVRATHHFTQGGLDIRALVFVL